MTMKPSPVSTCVPERSTLVFLVVEDDTTSRMILERALENLGYDVLTASNGADGVRCFEENHIDMVLMDIQMPVMDGFAASAKIKKLSKDNFVPVLFLTGSTDEEQLARCVEAGGDDFLTKPYSRVILGAKIEAWRRIRDLHIETINQHDLVAEHQARLIREQEVAETVFSSMLNRAGEMPPNIRCRVSPASIFNGDLVLVAKTPSSGVRVLIGDFTGHGLQAAIGGLPASDTFYSMTEKGFSIADVVRELNSKLLEILPTRMFFACALVEVNTDSNRLLLWSGGMPEVLVQDMGGAIRHRLPSKHLALGIRATDKISAVPEELPIEVGERVYIYSDGIIEASGPEGEMFGQARLEACLSDHGSEETVFEYLSAMLLDFTGCADQDDDFTLVELTHDGKVENTRKAEKRRAVRAALPWSAELVFDATTLREVDPLPLLTQMILHLQGLQEHREKIYMMIAELYYNALDHGLLMLDSALKETPQGFGEYYSERAKRLANLDEGRIKIRLTHEATSGGGRLRIVVKDSGHGFDFESKVRDLESNIGNSGRGMALIRSMCEQIVYSESGSCADASYVWSKEVDD